MSKRLLKYFKFSEPSSAPNTGMIPAGSLPFPAAGTSLTVGQETVLASVTLKKIHYEDRVFITGSVEWQALSGTAEMQFRIRRGGVTGTIVATYLDSGAVAAETPVARSYTTTINHAETGVHGRIEYVLTATLLTGTALIEGPISLEGFLIDEQ